MWTGQLFDKGANPHGLLERIVDDLLQIGPILGGLRESMAVLFDLAHIEQQRGQRSVEFARDRGNRLTGRQRARGGKLGDFGVIESGGGFAPARKKRIRQAIFVLRHIRCLTELTRFRS
jgi:hypothetical protein